MLIVPLKMESMTQVTTALITIGVDFVVYDDVAGDDDDNVEIGDHDVNETAIDDDDDVVDDTVVDNDVVDDDVAGEDVNDVGNDALNTKRSGSDVFGWI